MTDRANSGSNDFNFFEKIMCQWQIFSRWISSFFQPQDEHEQCISTDDPLLHHQKNENNSKEMNQSGYTNENVGVEKNQYYEDKKMADLSNDYLECTDRKSSEDRPYISSIYATKDSPMDVEITHAIDLNSETKNDNNEVSLIAFDHDQSTEKLNDDNVSSPIAVDNNNIQSLSTTIHTTSDATTTTTTFQENTPIDYIPPRLDHTESETALLEDYPKIVTEINIDGDQKIQVENNDNLRMKSNNDNIFLPDDCKNKTNVIPPSNDNPKVHGNSISKLKQKLFHQNTLQSNNDKNSEPFIKQLPKSSKSFNIENKPSKFVLKRNDLLKEVTPNNKSADEQSIKNSNQDTSNDKTQVNSIDKNDSKLNTNTETDVKRSQSSVAALKSKLGPGFNPLAGLKGGPPPISRPKSLVVNPDNTNNNSDNENTEPEILSNLNRSRSKGAVRRRPSTNFLREKSRASSGVFTSVVEPNLNQQTHENNNNTLENNINIETTGEKDENFHSKNAIQQNETNP